MQLRRSSRYIPLGLAAMAVPVLISLAATPNALKGDINGDNAVDIIDLSVLLTNYGKSSSSASAPSADINDDGTVNISDLSLLLSNFGQHGTVITEPAPYYNLSTPSLPSDPPAPFNDVSASSIESSSAGAYLLAPVANGHYATNVPDPAGLNRTAVKLVTDDRLGDGSVVRIALNRSIPVQPGQTVWFLNEAFIPSDTSDFPIMPTGMWYTWASAAVDGNGSSPISLGFLPGSNGAPQLLFTGHSQWRKQIQRGRWEVVARRVRYATSSTANDGWAEVYYAPRGQPLQPQTFENGQSRLTGINNFPTVPRTRSINYHRDNMSGWTAQTFYYHANHKFWFDGNSGGNVINVQQIDPFYTGKIN